MAARTRSSRSSHLDRLAAAARDGTGRRPVRGRGRDPRRRRAASTRGCTRTPATGARSPRSWPGALGGPLDPAAAGETLAATPAAAHPRRRGPVRRGQRDARRPAHPRPGRPARGHPRPPRSRRARASPLRRTARRPPIVTDPSATPSGARSRPSASIRRFAERPLEPDHLERILNAGRRAGSSKNLQRWSFIVCRDRAHLRRARGGRAVGRPPRRAPRSGSPS